jgi:hypothetical protein
VTWDEHRSQAGRLLANLAVAEQETLGAINDALATQADLLRLKMIGIDIAYLEGDTLLINGVRVSGHFFRSFFAGEIKEAHASIERRGDDLRFTALPCGRQLDEVRAAAQAYALALRERRHGGVAAGVLADRVLSALGIDWRVAPEVKP